MKKIFSIFLSVIFLASAMGVTINSHYCGMKLKSVSLSSKGCCCKKNIKMPKDCCKNEIKYVKITDDYSPSADFHFVKADIFPLPLFFAFIPKASPGLFSVISNNHSPPPKFADKVIAFRSILI